MPGGTLPAGKGFASSRPVGLGVADSSWQESLQRETTELGHECAILALIPVDTCQSLSRCRLKLNQHIKSRLYVL